MVIFRLVKVRPVNIKLVKVRLITLRQVNFGVVNVNESWHKATLAVLAQKLPPHPEARAYFNIVFL